MVAMEKCEPKYEPRCRIFFAEGQKFRTNLLVLFFDLPLKRETATKTALLAEVLRQGEDPTGAARQAELLFGAHWDISVVKKGERQLLLFSLEALKNVETEEMLAFLRERLFAPLQNGFTEKTVERQKKILRQKLENQKDDKKAFARRRALEETAKGTALAISGDGYAEDLEEIGAEGLLAFYRELLETARVKVFFCGEKDEALLSLRQNFKGKAAAEEEAAPDSKGKAEFFERRNRCGTGKASARLSGGCGKQHQRDGTAAAESASGRRPGFVFVPEAAGGGGALLRNQIVPISAFAVFFCAGRDSGRGCQARLCGAAFLLRGMEEKRHLQGKACPCKGKPDTGIYRIGG